MTESFRKFLKAFAIAWGVIILAVVAILVLPFNITIILLFALLLAGAICAILLPLWVQPKPKPWSELTLLERAMRKKPGESDIAYLKRSIQMNSVIDHVVVGHATYRAESKARVWAKMDGHDECEILRIFEERGYITREELMREQQ